MSLPLPESTTVLIVGAGPTGLAAALSLIHHDFRDFVIVDAVVQGENTSRALVIHAATLEALDSIGCGQVLVDKGFKAQSITIRNRTSELIRTDFSYLKPHTPHPYALALPQNITEQVLGQKLKDLAVHVHRPKRVVGMKRNVRDSLVTDVSFDDGSVISTKYVIGADGARSVVRTTAGIGFADPDGDNSTHVLSQMTLADVTFKGGDISSRGFVGVLNPDTFFLCVDFPNSTNELLAQNGQEISDRIYRIASSIPVADGPPPSHPPKEFMQALVDKYGPTYMSSDPSVNPTPLKKSKPGGSYRVLRVN
ncbi:hypothetical protein BJ138DRAFT_1177118 [Hygrophoropsis aurantiaca]|uniref:Uncharacterized protein n=1 Tax=Hygrophoropsis aurantiaca TaxID=72124 RepID=A0ACB8AN16_9AGAM|nr:hypothetical protein BJ138DRAFT_1177118 [Hygrophoropsis aurantiaca]